MSEELPRQASRWRRLPAGMLGMLVLVTALEAVTAWRSLGYAPISSLGARFSATEAKAGAAGCELLGLGDSSIKFGVDPDVFESRLGLRAYNLAVAGSPPPVAYFLLRRAIDAGARPLALLVGFVSLSSDSSDWTLDYAEFLTPLECLDLAWAERDARLFGRLIVPRLLPSARYRAAIRAPVMTLLRLGKPAPRPNPGGGAARASLRAWAQNRGADLNRAGRRFDGRLDPAIEASIYGQPWTVREANAHYLVRTAALARSVGTRVFWIIPPLAPAAQAKRDTLGLEAPHEQKLRSVHARMPNVVVLDARRSGYAAADFLDHCHLNVQGAGTFSSGIADALQRHFGQDETAQPNRHVWMHLPPLPNSPVATATSAQPVLTR